MGILKRRFRRVTAGLIAAAALLSGCEKKANDAPLPIPSSDYACSAWLTYWDAESALEEARAFPNAFEALICFEAMFDEDGNWVLPPLSKELLARMNELDTPVWLSLVNDIKTTDGSIVQKSRELLSQELLTPEARSAHIEKLLRLVDAYSLRGLEIDYENIKADSALWSAFSTFIGELYQALNARGVGLRVVMECRAPKYAAFPEGPVYSCMCYNLYGNHSGPGPKADIAFLKEIGESWRSVPGEVHMAFASGGFLWAGNKVQKSLTERDALDWLAQKKETPKRDADSGALKAVVFDDKKYTVWYADGETLGIWRDTLRSMGYSRFDLFRLGGSRPESLSAFLGAS